MGKEGERGGQRGTEGDRGGQRGTKGDRGGQRGQRGQRGTEGDRVGHRGTKGDRGVQRGTERDRGGQRGAEGAGAEGDRGGQRGAEGDRGGQRGTEGGRGGRGGQRGTEGDRGGQRGGASRGAGTYCCTVPRIYPSPTVRPPGLRNALGLVGFRYFNYDFLTRQTKEITKKCTLTPHIYVLRNDDAFSFTKNVFFSRSISDSMYCFILGAVFIRIAFYQ